MIKNITKILMLIFMLYSINVFAGGTNETEYSEYTRNASISLSDTQEAGMTLTCNSNLNGWWNDNGTRDISSLCDGTSQEYYSYKFKVSFENETINGSPVEYYGYCIDPGYHFVQSDGSYSNHTCQYASYDYGLKYLMRSAENGSAEALTAVRLYAMMSGWPHDPNSTTAIALSQYVEFMTESSDLYTATCGDNEYALSDQHCTAIYQQEWAESQFGGMKVSDFVQGDFDLYYGAYQLAKEAWEAQQIGQDSETSLVSSLGIEADPDSKSCSNKGTLFSVYLTSTKELEQLEITIKEGSNVSFLSSILKESGEDGYKYKLSFSTSNINCDDASSGKFKIEVNYVGAPGGLVYKCSVDGAGADYQQIIVLKDKSNMVDQNQADKIKSTREFEIAIPSTCYKKLNCRNTCDTGEYTPKLEEDCEDDGDDFSTKGGGGCCTDTTTASATQPAINTLFTDDDCLGVTQYRPKCNTSVFIAKDFKSNTDTTLLKKYCTMYCTEQSSASGGTTKVSALSGRYFKLTSIPKVSQSRSCRVITDYGQWLDDYEPILKMEAITYNKYQEYVAKKEMIADTIKGGDGAGSATVTISCSAYASVDDETDSCGNVTAEGCSDGTNHKSVACTIKWKNKYHPNASKYGKEYATVTTTDTDSNDRLHYLKLEIKEDTNAIQTSTYYSGTKNPSYQDVDTSDCDSKIASLERQVGAKCSSAAGSDSDKWNCSFSNNYDTITSQEYDLDGDLTKATNSTDFWEGRFRTYTDQAYKMEKIIKECTDYFSSGNGSNVSQHYVTQVSIHFGYDQVYLNDSGKIVESETPITLTGGCSSSVSQGEKYESKNVYSKWNLYQLFIDFKRDASLKRESTKTGFKKYLETYKHEKIMVIGGTYSGSCSWSDKSSTQFSMVPGGKTQTVVTKNTTAGSTVNANYTQRNGWYPIYLTTLKGKYEFRWYMSGFGNSGSLNRYVLRGSTCSGTSISSSTAVLSCTLEVDERIITIGTCEDYPRTTSKCKLYCDPSSDTGTCDIGYNFRYRTIDPSTIFSSYDFSKMRYAENWLNTTEGKTAISEITARGKSDTTYSPENLTYSVKLTTNDLQAIKNYNADKNAGASGYLDFVFACECGTNNGSSCSKCKSEFLKNLSAKSIKYGSVSYALEGGWTNKNQSLTQVRASGKVHWKAQIVAGTK